MANPNFSKIANRRGGMMRPGYKKGSNGKPISKSKNPGLVKLAKKKPELAKKGGKA